MMEPEDPVDEGAEESRFYGRIVVAGQNPRSAREHTPLLHQRCGHAGGKCLEAHNDGRCPDNSN